MIRADLNLEKWPLWQPAKAVHKRTRVLRRDLTTAQGATVTAEVTIGCVDRIGTLTTEDQKTCYALIKLWEDQGKPDDVTVFSLRRLARILTKHWGTNVISALTRSLTRLRVVPLLLQHAYYDSTTGETYEALDTFTILTDLKIRTTAKDGHARRAAGYFRFNDYTLASLVHNYTKPVLLDPILHFKSDIAQVLYQHLDLVLAHKCAYERRTQELFQDDLGLQGTSYIHAADRVRRLMKALAELRGVCLTTGVITTAELVRTTDSNDYKIIIRKSAARSTAVTRWGEVLAAPACAAAPDTLLREQARELVHAFYERFHGVVPPHLPAKALDQAVSLISQHGRDPARYLVEFSYKQAQETRYQPQTFGGILQYTARALHAYAQHSAGEAQQRAAASAARLQEHYEVYRREQLAGLRETLPPEELTALEEAVRTRLTREGTPRVALGLVVKTGVDEVLADRAGVPSFEAWCQQYREERHA
jgi:hypothetical protein